MPTRQRRYYLLESSCQTLFPKYYFHVTRDTRTYGHYCMLARALERVGDRWTLLIIRDLVGGPQRFTDLIERLVGITPKTLTQRLRSLEEDGLIVADREPGRREVWYRLSAAGLDVLPAVEELVLFGVRHSARLPYPGEAIHPEHLLQPLRIHLDRAHVEAGPVRWVIRFVDDSSYVFANDGGRWNFTPGDAADPDVVLTTTRAAFAKFLTTPASQRSTEHPDLEIVGGRRAIRTLMKAIETFPSGAPTAA
jgi:DNA-binding HxlR family transcriptional regulator